MPGMLHAGAIHDDISCHSMAHLPASPPPPTHTCSGVLPCASSRSSSAPAAASARSAPSWLQAAALCSGVVPASMSSSLRLRSSGSLAAMACGGAGCALALVMGPHRTVSGDALMPHVWQNTWDAVRHQKSWILGSRAVRRPCAPMQPRWNATCIADTQAASPPLHQDAARMGSSAHTLAARSAPGWPPRHQPPPRHTAARCAPGPLPGCPTAP